MEQISIESRKRICLKQTAKGKVYYECAVELFNKTNEEAVKELIDLKNKVEKEIPQNFE